MGNSFLSNAVLDTIEQALSKHPGFESAHVPQVYYSGHG